MEFKDLVLVDGIRTPMAAFNGSFADITAIDLAAHAARALFERTGIDPAEVDHTVVGNVQQTSRDALYGARHVALKAGVPIEKPALTVNRLCGSGVQAILSGAHMILAGDATTVLVGGMENMTQAPHVLFGARQGYRFGHGELLDSLMAGLLDTYCGCYMAQTSNNLANDFGISREEQDAYALRSQKLAAAAIEAGRLAEEIVPVEVGKGKRARTVSQDEHPRPDTTPEILAKLRPAFDDDGYVTAGNASGIVDGAAMLLLTTAEQAKAWGKQPLARLISGAVVGVDPSRMGIGPAPAIRQALGKAGMELGDLDVVEINEAFAGQVLACVKDLGLDIDKLNPNGGAIALGHPLGATGARITLTLAKELARRGGGRGVASACIGGGQGIALILENAG